MLPEVRIKCSMSSGFVHERHLPVCRKTSHRAGSGRRFRVLLGCDEAAAVGLAIRSSRARILLRYQVVIAQAYASTKRHTSEIRTEAVALRESWVRTCGFIQRMYIEWALAQNHSRQTQLCPVLSPSKVDESHQPGPTFTLCLSSDSKTCQPTLVIRLPWSRLACPAPQVHRCPSLGSDWAQERQ
jgi:hypothetical protein